MIALKIGDEFLDLDPNASVGIEMYNPLFQKEDQTPGTLTYTIAIPYSRKNQRILNSPENLSLATPPVVDFPCQFYINKILWKAGILKYRGFTGTAYSVNFQSDAGDFAALVKDVSLQAVNYRSGTLSASVKTLEDEYALFPIRNSIFFGDSEPVAGWNEYVNMYTAGSFSSPIVPFPYLKFILTQIVQSYGYTLSGDWLEEDYVKRLVIYNNYQPSYPGQAAGAPPNGTLNYQKHVPDIKVSEFFTAIRQLFGLAYNFDVKTKTLYIIRYADCIRETSYVDWTEQTEKAYSEETVEKTGFTLKQTIESEDELNKTLNTDWSEYKIGAGGELITTTASTLHMVRGPQEGRSWLVPATEQKGSSPFVGTGDNNKFSLRLLLYAGLKNDSMGNPYPLGSAVNENYTGSPFTDRSLYYAGQWGLYENNWKEWIAFLNQTRTIQRSVYLTIADLLNLSPTKKIMIDHSKYFYEKISLSVSSKDGIGKAKIDLKKVNV